jgi:anti-anti-sigma regulatory factor
MASASRVAWPRLARQADTPPLRVCSKDFDRADEVLACIADAAGPDLALDLQDVPALTNRGLARLVAWHKQVRASGGRFTLSGVRLPVWLLLAFAGLTEVLDVQ